MNTLELRGDLLNLFVALAMGGVEGQDIRAPFDEWDCGIIYKGNIFSPEKDVSLVWPTVMKLRISTTDVGDGRWKVTMPAPDDPLSPPSLRSTAPIRYQATATQSSGASSAPRCRTRWKPNFSAW